MNGVSAGQWTESMPLISMKGSISLKLKKNWKFGPFWRFELLINNTAWYRDTSAGVVL